MDSSQIKERFRLELESRGDKPQLDLLGFLLCQLGGYDVDIAAEQAKIQRAALKMAPTFNGVITSLFWGDAPLRGNPDNYYNVRNSMLCEVIRTGLGIPITLSVLAMEHARVLDVPMVGIGLPGHFLVGSGADPDVFADPFNGGRLLDRDGVRDFYRRMTRGQGTWREAFLNPVSSRDIVFRMLNNIRVACDKNLADRAMLPWVLELLSWFPNGEPFDVRAASRAVSAFN